MPSTPLWLFGISRESVRIWGCMRAYARIHPQIRGFPTVIPNETPLFRLHLKFLYNTPMIELNIPGRKSLQLEHLVCDVNGTLAIDGQLTEGLVRLLSSLSDRLTLHLLTADTHGRQEIIDHQLNLQAVRIHPGDEAAQKGNYIRKLGAEQVVAIGQGANDADMLKTAGLGICVVSVEGTAVEALLSADLVVSNIFDALHLLENPLRIVASLRK
jgi:soluble P-type ATPase